MATLRSYWKDVDDESFEVLEKALGLIFTLKMGRIYEGNQRYLNSLKNKYMSYVEGGMYSALYYGKGFFESVIKDMGLKPVNITRDDMRIAFVRSRSITQDYISAAVDDFSNDIRALSKNMRAHGLTKEEIVTYLFNERNENRPIYNRFNNRIKKVLDDAIDRAAALVYSEGMKRQFAGTNKPFKWVSVGDGRVCPDCLSRHLQEHTYNQWRKMGVPRAGYTFCLLSCRCILLPTEYVDDELDLSKPLVRKKVVIKDGKPVKKS